MRSETDYRKIFYILVAIIISIAGSYFGKPFISNNQDAINIIVTVFSILAGFLIAVITFVGDPQALPPGSWRGARLGSELVYNRLTRQKWLFYIYLFALVLIFISMLIKREFNAINEIIEYIYLGLAIFAFILSFTLPSALMEFQKERIEHEIFRRRKMVGIKDSQDND